MRPDNLRPILLVNKFDECFRFYRDVMGFKVGWGKEGDGYATFFVDEHIRLSIFKREQMAETIGTSGLPSESKSQDRIAIVFGVKDVVSTSKELEKQGARFVTPAIVRRDWGIRTIFLRDPDGNLLQFESPLQKDEWAEELRKEAGLYKGEI
jgi:catechol 2,3-dioxygenase-like lactoylglutathione lyase family enzyme